jgi:L,D-peptidoglycan transpeptidase YkuD (ErfK/YbiS/YcfS/YnhG family)
MLREVEHSGEKAQAPAAIDSIRKRHRERRVMAEMGQSTLRTIRVRAAPGSRTRGWLVAGPLAFPVALGRGGILANKREGDGGTPRGVFRLRRLWWRADRDPRPMTALPLRQITAVDAWCEDPDDRRYNRPVTIPPGAPGDRLRRDDQLYDLIIEIDHNTRPRTARRGSAVFIHVARRSLAPTAGCVAMPKARLQGLLKKVGPRTRIEIQ